MVGRGVSGGSGRYPRPICRLEPPLSVGVVARSAFRVWDSASAYHWPRDWQVRVVGRPSTLEIPPLATTHATGQSRERRQRR